MNALLLINTNLLFTTIFYVGEIFFSTAENYDPWIVFCMIISPVYVSYATLAVHYSFYILLNLRYLHIKQSYFIRVFKGFNKKMLKSEPIRRNFRFFLKIKSILTLLKEIRDYNHFWSKYITLTMTVYVFEICYIIFAFCTAANFDEQLRLAPLCIFASIFILHSQIISSQCSRLIINNCRIHQEIRRFHYRNNHVSLVFLIKSDNANCFQNILQKTSIRLLNGSRINNRFFEVMGSLVVGVLLKLFSRYIDSQL